MRKGAKLTEHDIKEIRRLRNKGFGLEELSGFYSVSKTTIIYHCKKKKRKVVIEKAKKEDKEVVVEEVKSSEEMLAERKKVWWQHGVVVTEIDEKCTFYWIPYYKIRYKREKLICGLGKFKKILLEHRFLLKQIDFLEKRYADLSRKLNIAV